VYHSSQHPGPGLHNTRTLTSISSDCNPQDTITPPRPANNFRTLASYRPRICLGVHWSVIDTVQWYHTWTNRVTRCSRSHFNPSPNVGLQRRVQVPVDKAIWRYVRTICTCISTVSTVLVRFGIYMSFMLHHSQLPLNVSSITRAHLR
jgi:hypothetical protein